MFLNGEVAKSLSDTLRKLWMAQFWKRFDYFSFWSMHKARVSIIYLPLFSVVYSLCFKKCFLFSNLFKDFLDLCCLIMPLLVNFLVLYFQRSMYSIVCIPFGFDGRRTAQKITFSETIIFLPCVKSRRVPMHCLCQLFASLKLLQSHLLEVYLF